VWAAGWLLVLLPAQARPGDTARSDELGTFLGALFGPVSGAPSYQVEARQAGNRGVQVTHVLPDSPAARADLHRRDILLKYNQVPIRDCEHLARLIQADRPESKVKLLLRRGQREETVEVTLGLGPALRIAPKGARDDGLPRGIAKPAGPPAVSVAATPLEQGRMKVTIEYYQEGTGRLRTVTCQGGNPEIDSAVSKLPERERNLVRVALERIRELNSRKAPDARTTPR
jgi:hypothetical protein